MRLLFLFGILFFAGCSSDKKDIERVIQNQATAMNQGNLLMYMRDIYPNPAAVEQTKKVMGQIFSLYKLDVRVEKMSEWKIGDQEATVEVTQATRKKSGPAFRNNRNLLLFYFKKDSKGFWKITRTDSKKMESLKD